MSEQVNLHAAGGQFDKPIEEVVRELLSQVPTLVWCEPVPARSRKPWCWLSQGDHRALRDNKHPIEEARLFWRDGWVHLVAGRWAAFREEVSPDWLPAAQQEVWPVTRSKDDVVLLRDWKRYCMGQLAGGMPKDAKVFLYTNENSLIGWRLTL
jgi:hypothetical protein